MKFFISLLVLLLHLPLMAEISLPALFSDGMILQQKIAAPVWGWAPAGTQVSVQFGSQSKNTSVDSSGKWMLKLDPLEANAQAQELKITVGSETKTISDVLVGEVWLCGGQSNMDFTMAAIARPSRTPETQIVADTVAKEVATANDDLFRQISVPKTVSAFKELNNFKGSWIKSSPENNGNFSCTGYFFGRELRRKLNVPVALIKAPWGGTLVEPWIPMDSFKETAELTAFYKEKTAHIEKGLKYWDQQKIDSQYKKTLDDWKVKFKEAKANKKKLPRKPKKRQRPDMSNRDPSTLYNGMIHCLAPYAIKGAIWYQGESNANYHPELYENHFSTLIKAWRKVWAQGDFPFYYVQLASFKDAQSEPLEKDGWATVLDQQRRTLKVKNTGMAIANDIGEAKDIHPKNKIEVGQRLSLWALKKDYGQDIAHHSGPLYQKAEFANGQAIISFTECADGLKVAEKTALDAPVDSDKALSGFQVCGADRQWKWANAKITSKNQVTVSHAEIKEPTEVRYFWYANIEGKVRLYNSANLPASTFTTAK